MHARTLRVVAASIVTGAMVAVPVAGAAGDASGNCRAKALTRNVWHRIPAPPHAALRDAALLDDDGCTALGITDSGATFATVDGAAHWLHYGQAPGPGRLFTAGLAPDNALLALDGESALTGGSPGLAFTTDGARSWQSATGLAGKHVLDVAVDPTNRQRVYAAVSAPSVAGRVNLPGVASVYSSGDGGRSWTAMPTSAAFAATSVAVDGTGRGVVWATGSGSAGGVWVSSGDTGVFREVSPLEAHDVASIALPGGGSQTYVAAATGVLVSRDQGTTVTPASTGLDVLALGLEPQHYQVLMLSTTTGVRRSADAGSTARLADTGLPRTCHPSAFNANSASPATFVARCDAALFAYRGDGTDFGAADRPPAGLPNIGPIQLTDMQRLRILHESHKHLGEGESGSVAFDGDYLYYTNRQDPAALHRVDARTGRDAGDLRIKGLAAALGDPTQGNFLVGITYDSLRHQLYAMDWNNQIYDIDLRTRTYRSMFVMSGVGVASLSSFSYDTGVDEFFAVIDHATTVFSYDRSGRPALPCTVNIPQQYYDSAHDDEYTVSGPGIAAVVATGDGYLYAELEDDATTLRLDRGCRVLAAYRHEVFSEASDENDALACDTVTFHTGAVWMRDAQTGRLVAYKIPGGYCALATRVRLSAPASASPRAPANVCAQLVRAGNGEPIAGVYVDLLAANRSLSHARTDSNGITCAAYSPSAADAGAEPDSPAGHATTHAPQPLLAAFLGTQAFRPSYDRGGLTAMWTPPLAPPAPLVAAVAPAVISPGAGPPPVVVAPAPPAPPPAPQVQPLPQAHPGAQPGAQAMGQPGAAAQNEEEPEAATATVHRDEFRARPAPQVPLDLRVVLPVGALLGAVVARRRRASLVRAQRS